MFEKEIARLKKSIGKFHFVERYLSYLECMQIKYYYPNEHCCEIKKNLKAVGMVSTDR